MPAGNTLEWPGSSNSMDGLDLATVKRGTGGPGPWDSPRPAWSSGVTL